MGRPRARKSKSSTSKPEIYVCINCGHVSPLIYKTYALTTENLMKLVNCRKCGQLVDKFIEYDVIIVAINLILLRQPAYRHTLINDPFRAFWKLGIIYPFCEAYCYWCFQKGMEATPATVDFYELENDFYRVLLRTAVGTVVFHGFILMTAFFRANLFQDLVRQNFTYVSVLKGTCMCGFFTIFELIALVWSYSRKDSQYWFIYGMQFISNVHSYRATTTALWLSSSAVIVTAMGLKYLAVQIFDEQVPRFDF